MAKKETATKKKTVKKETKKTVKKAVKKVDKKSSKSVVEKIKEKVTKTKAVKEETKVLDPTELGVVSRSIKEDRVAQRFEDYKRTNKILYGTVEQVVGEDKLFVVVDFDGIDVLIPDESFFPKDYEFGKDYAKYNDERKLSKRKISARFRIGSTTPFTIDAIQRPDSSKEFALIGNRVKALSMIKHEYFSKGSTRVGAEVKANVLAVFENFVLVECLGIETRLSAYNLTDTTVVDNCTRYCHSGDVLDVRIKKIKKNSEDDIYLAVSGRLNKGAKYIKDMNVGDAFMGYVDGYNKEKRIYTIKTKKGTNVSVHAMSVISRGGLNRGDKVAGVIKAKENDYIIGTCRKI